MSQTNPYDAPKANVTGSPVGNNSGSISSEIIAQLKRTRPWVMLLSILGFISTLFMAIATVGIFFAGGQAMLTGAGPRAASIMGGGAVIGITIFYALMTLFYFFASLYLFKYARSIKKAVSSKAVGDVESALKSQASFWKLIGILALVMIIITVVGIGASVAIPLMAR